MSELNFSYEEKLSDGLKREFEISIDSNEFEKNAEDKLFEIQKTIKVDGFRPGKVPIDFIRKKHMGYVLQETSSDLMNKALTEFFKKQEFTFSMRPDISDVDFGQGKPLKFITKFEIMPTIPEIKIEGVSVDSFDVEIPDEDVMKEIAYIKSNSIQFNKLAEDRNTQDGDKVIIDFVGKVDGTEFEGGAAQDYELVLGSKRFIDNFEEQLIGKAINDEILVKVNFPDEYFKEELKGKAAEFDVKIKDILAAKDMSDEDLAKSQGFDNFDAFKEKVKNDIKSQYDRETKMLAKKKLFDLWDKEYKFAVPECMIDNELKQLKAQYQKHDHNHEHDENCNHDHDEKSPSDEKLQVFAERRVRLGLILSEVAIKNKVEVTQEDLQKAVYQQAMSLGMDVETVAKFFQGNENAVKMLRDSVLEEKASEWILDNITITKKTVDKTKFQDILKEEYDEQLM